MFTWSLTFCLENIFKCPLHSPQGPFSLAPSGLKCYSQVHLAPPNTHLQAQTSKGWEWIPASRDKMTTSHQAVFLSEKVMKGTGIPQGMVLAPLLFHPESADPLLYLRKLSASLWSVDLLIYSCNEHQASSLMLLVFHSDYVHFAIVTWQICTRTCTNLCNISAIWIYCYRLSWEWE